MKKSIFGIVLILMIGANGLAQNRKMNPDSLEDGRRAPAQSNSAENTDNVLLRSGASLEAELQNTLDVKKSKVGDEVVLKITKTIREDGRVIIPKGTRLIGRITEVQRKTKDTGLSKIGVVFESIEGRNLSAPLNATVIAVANISNNVAAGDLFGSNTAGSSASAQTSSSAGGGGLVGGAVNTTVQTVGSVADTVGSSVGSTVQPVGGNIKQIQINQTIGASANSSTTFSTSDKNLRIEKGANFQVRVNESVNN